MTIPFPAYRPTRLELQLPGYPVITNAWRATAWPERLGSLPEDARLRLGYENITDAEALELLLLWRATAGGYYPLNPLPADVAAGIDDAALADRILDVVPMVWVPAEPPSQESVKAGRSTVNIELKTELRFSPTIVLPSITCPAWAEREDVVCAGSGGDGGGGEIPSVVTGYYGGVLGPDNRVYGIPASATSVLEVDTSTAATSDFGTLPAGTQKWSGGVLAPNGIIYGIPAFANNGAVLKIDPAAKTATTFGAPAVGTPAASRWVGGVLAPNGKIYCVPNAVAQVLAIDPATETLSLFGALPGGVNDGWHGGALAANEKIYCAPYGAQSVLEINPATNTVATFGTVSSSVAKWVGAVLAPNGAIYCVPYNAQQVLKINPGVNTVALVGSTLSASSGKWAGGILASNGKIYCAPLNADSVLVIDTNNDTVSMISGLGSDALKWAGFVMGQTGRLYGIPFDATSVLEFAPSPLPPPNPTVLSPVYNKL